MGIPPESLRPLGRRAGGRELLEFSPRGDGWGGAWEGFLPAVRPGQVGVQSVPGAASLGVPEGLAPADPCTPASEGRSEGDGEETGWECRC